MAKEDEYVPRQISRRHHRSSAIKGQATIEMFFKSPSPKKSKKLVLFPNKTIDVASSIFHITSPTRSNSLNRKSLTPSKTLISKVEEENDENCPPGTSCQKSSFQNSRLEGSIKSASSQASNISTTSETESGSWREDERCLNCWKFGKLSKPYRLCSQSEALLRLEAENNCYSKSTAAIQRKFNLLYAELKERANELSKIPVLQDSNENAWKPPENYYYCSWCGMKGTRKDPFCKKCKKIVFAPL